VTNTGEIRHFTTILKSGDPATPLHGTRRALVKARTFTWGTYDGCSLLGEKENQVMKGAMKVIGFEEHYGLPAIYEAAKKANDPYLQVLEALKKAGHFPVSDDPKVGTIIGTRSQSW
jgi:hypothetical protein